MLVPDPIDPGSLGRGFSRGGANERPLDIYEGVCYATKRESSAIPNLQGAVMGDSYREALKKNQTRIRAANSTADNRAKAATRAAIRKLNHRKSLTRYNQAPARQVGMDI